MSDITTISRNGTVFEGPSLPLQRLMAEYGRYEASGELSRYRPDVPLFVAEECAQRLAAMQEGQVTMAAVLAWLTPVAAAVSQPPDEHTFRARAAAILAACSDLPVSAFSQATSLAAVRKFQWFPAAAEVRALLMDETAEIRREKRAMRMLAVQRGGSAPEPPREPQTVREQLAAKLRGVVAEVEARAETETPGNAVLVKSQYLRGEHLQRARAENPLIQAARAIRDEIR